MKNNKFARWSGVLTVAVLAVLALASVAAGADPGSSWDKAVNITGVLGKQQTLAAGASEWYAVRYTGGMQDEIDLSDNGVGGMTFAVYTPDEVAAWANTGTLSAIGMGSTNIDEPNYDLTWAGHPEMVDGTIYYVQVTNNNPFATSFSLNASATPLAQPGS